MVDSVTWMTQSAYADLRQVSRQRIHALAGQGRIVTRGDGLVNVEATDALLDATLDPARREMNAGAEQAARADALADARTRELEAKARKAELEVGRLSGELVELAAVENAAREQGTRLRVLLEGWPDRLAYEFATMGDGEQIRRRLADEVEGALREFSAGALKAAASDARAA